MYGMGEKSVVEIADALNAGMDVRDITYVDGTVFRTSSPDDSLPSVMLPSFEELKNKLAKEGLFAEEDSIGAEKRRNSGSTSDT